MVVLRVKSSEQIERPKISVDAIEERCLASYADVLPIHLDMVPCNELITVVPGKGRTWSGEVLAAAYDTSGMVIRQLAKDLTDEGYTSHLQSRAKREEFSERLHQVGMRAIPDAVVDKLFAHCIKGDVDEDTLLFALQHVPLPTDTIANYSDWWLRKSVDHTLRSCPTEVTTRLARGYTNLCNAPDPDAGVPNTDALAIAKLNNIIARWQTATTASAERDPFNVNMRTSQVLDLIYQSGYQDGSPIISMMEQTDAARRTRAFHIADQSRALLDRRPHIDPKKAASVATATALGAGAVLSGGTSLAANAAAPERTAAILMVGGDARPFGPDASAIPVPVSLADVSPAVIKSLATAPSLATPDLQVMPDLTEARIPTSFADVISLTPELPPSMPQIIGALSLKEAHVPAEMTATSMFMPDRPTEVAGLTGDALESQTRQIIAISGIDGAANSLLASFSLDPHELHTDNQALADRISAHISDLRKSYETRRSQLSPQVNEQVASYLAILSASLQNPALFDKISSQRLEEITSGSVAGFGRIVALRAGDLMIELSGSEHHLNGLTPMQQKSVTAILASVEYHLMDSKDVQAAIAKALATDVQAGIDKSAPAAEWTQERFEQFASSIERLNTSGVPGDKNLTRGYWPAGKTRELAQLIWDGAHGVSASDPFVTPERLAAMLYRESLFANKAGSGAGAVGIAQFMPDTGRMLGLSIDDLRDPAKAIPAAAKYLSTVHKQVGTRYRGDGNYEQRMSYGAYNTGPGNAGLHGKTVVDDPSYAKGETFNYVRSIEKILGQISSSIPAAPKQAAPTSPEVNPGTPRTLRGDPLPDKIGGHVYYSQHDSRYGKIPYTLGGGDTIQTSGCGPTSMAALVSDLTGQTINPDKMATDFIKNNYLTSAGTSHAAFSWAAKKYGLQFKSVSYDPASIRKAIESGARIVVGSPPVSRDDPNYPQTTGGHVFWISGITDDGKFWLSDPNNHKLSSSPVEASVLFNKGWAAAYAISK